MKNKKTKEKSSLAQCAPRRVFAPEVTPLHTVETSLYSAVREAVPIIDAALLKLVRLCGGFEVVCSDKKIERKLKNFFDTVSVGGGVGVNTFLERYLDSLLCYGNAVGEIVLNSDKTEIVGLYNAPLENVELKEGKDSLDPEILIRTQTGELVYPNYPHLIFFTPLNPKSGEVKGRSLLSGLEFFASILTTVYKSIGQNFERAGNVRYAVNYNPPAEFANSEYANDIAKNIAQEWADGMNATKNGVVKDFVAVGDVDVKVIGAGNVMPEVQIPVRALCEQIVAKLGIPPFMLGLSWSTTERMSSQQADILTSELTAYRRHLEPIIKKIADTFLALNFSDGEVKVKWSEINLQDEVELARAELYRAQAWQIKEGKNQ